MASENTWCQRSTILVLTAYHMFFYHTCRYSYITYIRHCSFIKEFSLSPIFFRHACHFLYRTTVTKLMVCMRSDVPASCASAESSTPRRPRKVARPSSGPNLHILSAFFFTLSTCYWIMFILYTPGSILLMPFDLDIFFKIDIQASVYFYEYSILFMI